jgi:hypothetical protein
MTKQEREMSEQESLALITEMIGKARNHFHESGTSAILWGAVVSFCGFLSFIKYQWNVAIGFDIWLLALIAIVPQIFISIRERRRNLVKTHTQSAIDVVWLVYAISIFALIFYLNIVPGVTERLLLQNDGVKLMKQQVANGTIEPQGVFIPSFSSLMLIIYAFPTICTGLISRFRPMVAGAIICYALFIVSLFTITTYDYLFMGLAGIFNWLVPGIILRKRYMRAKHV